MSANSSENERLKALKTELALVKAELLNLQSARSVRGAKFLKSMLRAKPSEWNTVLRQLPTLLTKIDSPSVERLVSEEESFSSVHNPRPLFRYPNLNVATIGSAAREIFELCCNTHEISDEVSKILSGYNSISLIAISAHEYKSVQHKSLVLECLKKNQAALLIVLYRQEDEVTHVRKDLGHLNPTYVCLDPSADKGVMNHIDIYTLDHHPVGTAGMSSIYTSKSFNYSIAKLSSTVSKYSSATAVKPSSLVVIDNDDLYSFGPTKRDSIRFITTQIARGVPVILRSSSRPRWLCEDVILIKHADELAKSIDQFSAPFSLERYAVKCRRTSIIQYNALNCVNDLLSRLGIHNDAQTAPKISVILASKRPELLAQSLQQLSAQTIKPFEIILCLHGTNDKELKKIKPIIQATKLSVSVEEFEASVLFGDVLNSALEKVAGDYVTKIDDDDFYSPNHLLDLYAAHLHSQADIVGKWSHWVYLKSEDETICWVPEYSDEYVIHLPGGTMFAKTSVLKNLRFGKVKRAIDSELHKRAVMRGAVLYSTHRYNYIRVRDKDHTYQTTNADFKTRAHKVTFQGLPLSDVLSV